MISGNEIDELCSYILTTGLWTQKVMDWLTANGALRESTDEDQQKVKAELTSNKDLASEIIKCTLAQVNEDEWTVEIWKDKLKKQGKSFDITLQITFNYLTWLLTHKKLNVVVAWALLYRHKIVWTPDNSRMNRLYNGRTKFYFDVDAALSEEAMGDVHSCPIQHSSAHSFPDAVSHLNLAVSEILPRLYIHTGSLHSIKPLLRLWACQCSFTVDLSLIRHSCPFA